ncbi:MAG TPA: hypothetical protein VNA66_03470 [Gammaproteobacteria bacterium]|nr:hypothetical protein [Gammaproteobacteria bacterium]
MLRHPAAGSEGDGAGAAANARYDAATDHGRNAIAEADAIVFVIAVDP